MDNSRLLEQQGIKALMAVPLVANDTVKVVGKTVLERMNAMVE